MGDPGPYFFKSRKAREEGEDFTLAEVARATSAAPTYFEPFELEGQALVDGGVFAANPAMCAVAEVLRFQPAAEIALLSLGTGQRTRKRSFAEVHDWGLVEWAKPILDVVFDGASDAVDYQLRHVARREPLLAPPGRAQPRQRRPRRRERAQPARAARARPAADRRALGRHRRRDRRAQLAQGPVSTGPPSARPSASATIESGTP